MILSFRIGPLRPLGQVDRIIEGRIIIMSGLRRWLREPGRREAERFFAEIWEVETGKRLQSAKPRSFSSRGQTLEKPRALGVPRLGESELLALPGGGTAAPAAAPHKELF